ncbi:MAG TPA: GNAT family N-acetyltransferase [Anaerolineales bacterium]|nr:GNAT family N-acetyltransferase [Anaerolineales bacterium]
MKPYHRPFDDTHNDFEKMWRFLQQDYGHKQERFIWHYSRLGDWKYGLWREQKYIPSFFRKHSELWVDAFDQLLGFVLSEDGEEVFFIFTLQGYEYLYAEMLDWTLHNWGPRFPRLLTEVHEYQAEALAMLQNRGFRSEGVVATTRQYDLMTKEAKPIQLPAGYRIMDMCENGDFHNKSLLYNAGFGNEDHVTDFELLRFEYSRENPAYDPRFDLSVVTPEGLHVAGCVGFHDPVYGIAEIEKVCTHYQHRRQGLAEAVIRECFQRLKKAGMKRAYITGYSEGANALYEKLGPCWQKQWFHYELAQQERRK